MEGGIPGKTDYLKSKGVEGLSEQLVPGPIGLVSPPQSLLSDL